MQQGCPTVVRQGHEVAARLHALAYVPMCYVKPESRRAHHSFNMPKEGERKKDSSGCQNVAGALSTQTSASVALWSRSRDTTSMKHAK